MIQELWGICRFRVVAPRRLTSLKQFMRIAKLEASRDLCWESPPSVTLHFPDSCLRRKSTHVSVPGRALKSSSLREQKETVWEPALKLAPHSLPVSCEAEQLGDTPLPRTQRWQEGPLHPRSQSFRLPWGRAGCFTNGLHLRPSQPDVISSLILMSSVRRHQ